jgi:molybdopterin molybdotransferase
VASSGAVKVRHLGYAEARARVLDGLAPLPSESCPLDDARGRALNVDVFAAHALPPFANSSMDGYALRAADLRLASEDNPLEMPVTFVIPAGHIATRRLVEGEAMRIMTGAMIPAGADAVLAFEDVERLETPGAPERVRIGRPAQPRENVREAGADLGAGECAVSRGRELSPHDLALLAALGVADVTVGARPEVILLSTGDELLDVTAPLVPGAIRDSNVPLLRALVAEAGGRVVRAVRIADDPGAVAAAIRSALSEADVVLTIGGVSAGDFDPVKLALEALGDVELWRVAMKPGRPQAFGTPGGRLFFGLPGNPASVSCVFEALVRPALRRLQGFTALDRPRIPVRAASPVESRAGRTDFVRVTLAWRDGEAWAMPAGAQISGHLTPQARAHALLVIPDSIPRLETGDRAEALLLRAPESPG